MPSAAFRPRINGDINYNVSELIAFEFKNEKGN